MFLNKLSIHKDQQYYYIIHAKYKKVYFYLKYYTYNSNLTVRYPTTNDQMCKFYG